MGDINWGKLVAQNRVKAPGIPWTEEELNAIYHLGIDPEDVRNGILTKEEADSQDQNNDVQKPLKKMKKDELVKIAQDLGLQFDENVVSKGDLILEIEKMQEQQGSEE